MTRIENLKTYLVNVLNELQKEYKIMNVNFLDKEVDNYSIDRIPTQTEIERWITGKTFCKDVYNFRSRNSYNSNVAENLSNIGFWEAFENKIYSNNEQGILPVGTNKIVCLNSGSLQRADAQTCEMSIQIQIEYEKEE